MRAAEKRQVAVSISAAGLGNNIRFDKMKEGAAGPLIVHEEDEAKRDRLTGRLFRNATHLVEVKRRMPDHGKISEQQKIP